MARQEIYQDPTFGPRGLHIFANATAHDQATNKVDRFMQAGVTYTAPFDARPNDEIGIGIAKGHVNHRYRDNQRRANQAAGLASYDDPAFTPLQHAETSMEIYYGSAVSKWLVVRPNLQYILDPGGVSEVDDALIAGLKFEVNL